MKRLSIAVLGAALMTALVVSPPAHADDAEIVTAAETTQALAATPGLLAESDAVRTSGDADSAAVSTEGGTTLDVPKDAGDGVTIDAADAPAISVDLPNADEAGTGRLVAAGTVAYPAANGASNAVQVVEGGGVRMLTVIDSAEAPTEYAYDVTVPGGGRIALRSDSAGAEVLDAAGEVVAVVQAPWARAADGGAVPTRFSTDGATLTQHVAHAGAAYPVTADPFWVIAPAAIVAAFTAAVYACGIGYLAGAAWQIFWNGWVWHEVRRAGREGCVEGVVGRFIPWSKIRHLIKR